MAIQFHLSHAKSSKSVYGLCEANAYVYISPSNDIILL